MTEKEKSLYKNGLKVITIEDISSNFKKGMIGKIIRADGDFYPLVRFIVDKCSYNVYMRYMVSIKPYYYIGEQIEFDF